MNNVIYFEIQTEQPERAVKFYETVFGWEFSKEHVMEIDYWRIKTEGINGDLLKRPAPIVGMEHGTNAFTCSMEVENFDKTADVIMKNGGIVAMGKFAVPGKCWQGYFLDTEGNVFGVIQVDPEAK